MADLFDPATYGLILQRDFETRHIENVEHDFGELGNRRSVAVSQKVARRWSLIYRAYSRAARDYFVEFYRRQVGSAGIFEWDSPEYVGTPQFAPTLEAVSGGTQASQEIDCQFTWKNTNGETMASAIAELTVPANNLLRVTIPVFPPSVDQVGIYAVDGAGTPQLQTTLTDTRIWTQPDAPLLVATSDPPSANTAIERIQVRFQDQSFSERRRVGITYEITIGLEEVY